MAYVECFGVASDLHWCEKRYGLVSNLSLMEREHFATWLRAAENVNILDKHL